MDIVQIIGNLLLITLLGILVAFNPMLIVVDILLVLRTKRPILNTIILMAGFVTSILFLFIIAKAVIDPDSQISLRKLSDQLDIPPLIDIFAGVMLLSYSLKRWRRHKAYAGPPKQATLKIPEKSYQLFSFAFIKASLSVTNIFAILILVKQAAIDHWNTTIGLMAVLWLLLIGIVPLLVIAYYRQFKHESLKNIDKRINSFLSRDTESLIVYVLLAVSGFFIIEGLINQKKK